MFNLGKKFKSGRNQWDVGGFANASTFTVANNEDVEVIDDDEEVVEEQLDELVEESFTVVLDEKGNLQEIEVSPSEIVQELSLPRYTNESIEVVVNEEVVNIIEEQSVDVPFEEEGVAKIQDQDDQITNDGQYEEGISETQEFEVEVNNSEVKVKMVATAMLSFNQVGSNELQVPPSQSKLFERQVSSKSDLPRSFEGVKLSLEDEGVLASAPKPEEISTRDLQRFQIGKRSSDFPKGGKKWESCPSRQAHLCPYCRQVLKTRNALSRHISVVHLDVKNFQCDQCDRSYATKADVMKHVRATHSELRNLMVECDICGEEFKECYLKRHQYYKHKGNNLPKECPHCSKEFKTREVMMKHIRKIHKKK